MQHKPAKLALADGTIFHGLAFGAAATRGGELVFNTAHTGYQEVLTDPSYAGQIVCMTSAQQGNYGIARDDDESASLFIEGFVVRELSNIASNYRSEANLHDWLLRHGVPGISGIDTRALTLRLRETGAINAVIDTTGQPDSELVRQACAIRSLAGADLVSKVATREAVEWTAGPMTEFAVPFDGHPGGQKTVVAIDCGMKRNILRSLVGIGCRVWVVPPTTSSASIRDYRPDGIFVSNGPGDPAAVHYVIRTLRELASEVPTFGICLGHQLLAEAFGAGTFKMKFGHHGYNHPVRNSMTDRVEITSQNHGFAVSPDALNAAGLELTHVNLYDGTVEGFRHRELPVFAVQYHPEAAPGPHDAAYLFDVFRSVMNEKTTPSASQMRDAQARLAATVS